jgi:hypothetical protein
MWYRRFSALVCMVVVLVGGKLVCAKQTQDTAPQARCHRLEALASELGLSAQQKEEIATIHADFAKNACPLQQLMRALRQEQREAMRQILTQDQRARVKEVIQAQREAKWQAIAARLNLGDVQKERIDEIRRAYAQRFADLAAQQGEHERHQFRDLRHEKYQAIARQLTDEQRVSFGEMVPRAYGQHRDSGARVAFWKSVGEKLGTSPEQKDQFKMIHTVCAAKMESPKAQFQQLRQESRAAMLRVLTEEQRVRFLEIRQEGR